MTRKKAGEGAKIIYLEGLRPFMTPHFVFARSVSDEAISEERRQRDCHAFGSQ